MYTREENYKSRKTNKNMPPSFSSTLLDEIYRSIDGGAAAEKTEDFNQKPLKKQSSGGSSLRRACLVEKWMEKEANNEKLAAKRTPATLLPEQDNNDVLFFSSTSSSSDSSGALSSSSDTEFFGSTTTAKKPPKVSCFSSTTRPKPVRTAPPARVEPKPQKENRFLFDDYNNSNQTHQKNKVGDNDLIFKSKSRALKIYANLKKVKQPISPGLKLTSFINSLFTNHNTNPKILESSKSPKPSSASSFSRSCLSKYSPKSMEKMKNNLDQKSVRFQDLKPKKPVYDDNHRRPPLPPHSLAELKFGKKEKNRKVEDAAKNVLRGYSSKIGDDFSVFRKFQEDDNDDEDDVMSDSSSDLFELDHLAFFGDNRFCEELPVYETTRLDTNRGGVSRLVR